jgi:hypothetical protein
LYLLCLKVDINLAEFTGSDIGKHNLISYNKEIKI